MEQTSFFEDKAQLEVPLATRMRPRSLEEFAGQRHLLGEGKVLRRLIEGDRVSSMIFWGPPGGGEDHPGQDYRRADPLPLYQLQRRHQRYQRDQAGDGAGGAQPPPGGADHPVRG